MKKSLFKYAVVGCICIFIGFSGTPAFAGTDSAQVPSVWSVPAEVPSIFSTTPSTVWSCWYWPYLDSLNPNLYDTYEAMWRYDKYDIGAKSRLWEYYYHGPPQNPAGWWGHCHAWAGAAVWEYQPTTSRIRGGQTFRIRDRKGLIVETYFNCADGYHNEMYVNDPSPGLFWRWLRKEILGKNPMHGHAMGFIGELYWGPQVWNYPIYNYSITYSGYPRSGTMTIYVASDSSPSYADSTARASQTFTYKFSGVKVDASGEPINSGTWIGSGAYYRPDAIWRPYYAPTWMYYVVNTQLDETHLANICNP